jgi:hypothetical protein
MPCLFESPLHLNSFMESSVVHHEHTFFGEFRDQILFDPRGEDFRIDVGLENS